MRSVTGYVVAVGRRWALLAQVGDATLDGWIAVRLRDVRTVRRAKNRISAEYAPTQPGWPPVPPDGIVLDDVRSVLTTMAEQAPVIGIEATKPSGVLWIGRLTGVHGRWFGLQDVLHDGTWRGPLGYRLRRVTTVEFGGRYLTAVAAVGGPPPEA